MSLSLLLDGNGVEDGDNAKSEQKKKHQDGDDDNGQDSDDDGNEKGKRSGLGLLLCVLSEEVIIRIWFRAYSLCFPASIAACLRWNCCCCMGSREATGTNTLFPRIFGHEASGSWCHIECCKANKRMIHGCNFWIRSCQSCGARIAGASRIIGVDLKAKRFKLFPLGNSLFWLFSC
ncbi:hypothetical protein RHMOL_Rhmol13G0243600 [Rhododendron molle]|uniref:Uncharacterized protein n=1 Tax=Rhododendron molle TaxID=49168 RepID=A0ACC0LA62_RHOML|nr:hypothetical protein RHMOL_Rhmol13G0243600 [Rhododendron molle]